MNIYIASDHRGVEVKKELIKYLNNYNVIEIETINENTDDYPDFAFKLCNKMINDSNSLGILICGNGIGMSIAANKVKGIRCARVVSSDDAYKARSHNMANVIAIGANQSIDELKVIVDTFINSNDEIDERHKNRVNKIINYENGAYNEL